MNAIVQHECGPAVRVVKHYEATCLGAPFTVFLVDAVKHVIAKSGKVKPQIPDLPGLLKAVVQSRVLHQRKLNGAELKFIRRALGVKAKTVAPLLDVTAEHLSRCEAGTKTLSGASEKLFRLYCFTAAFYSDPELAMSLDEDDDASESVDLSPNEAFKKLVSTFLGMDIKSMYDPMDTLCFEFVRVPCDDLDSTLDSDADCGKWHSGNKLKAA